MNVKEYRGADGEIVSEHYAFLATEAKFDEMFARIRERRLPCGLLPRVFVSPLHGDPMDLMGS